MEILLAVSRFDPQQMVEKGVVYAAESPERRAVLQVVGRRADVALDEEWGDTRPRTQIVAIGAPGSIDAEALTQQFDAYLSANGMGATA